jgi:hypothetical protein
MRFADITPVASGVDRRKGGVFTDLLNGEVLLFFRLPVRCTQTPIRGSVKHKKTPHVRFFT